MVLRKGHSNEEFMKSDDMMKMVWRITYLNKWRISVMMKKMSLGSNASHSGSCSLCVKQLKAEETLPQRSYSNFKQSMKNLK